MNFEYDWDEYKKSDEKVAPGKEVGSCNVKNLPPGMRKISHFDILRGVSVESLVDLKVESYQPRM